MHANKTAGGISFRIAGGGPFQQTAAADQHPPAGPQNGFQRDHGFIRQENQTEKNLNQLTAQGAANLNDALRRGALEARQAGVAIVLSDFLDPAGYESGLTALVGRGFQVNAVQILAPDELSPGTYGDLRLVDAETGAMQEVTFGRYRLRHYQQTVQNFCQRLREFCTARGVNFFTAPSNTPLEELLLKQLREAEVWG